MGAITCVQQRFRRDVFEVADAEVVTDGINEAHRTGAGPVDVLLADMVGVFARTLVALLGKEQEKQQEAGKKKFA